jgi:hypothetical protein
MAYHAGLNREAAQNGDEVAEASVFATNRKPVVVKESGKCKPMMVALVDTSLEEASVLGVNAGLLAKSGQATSRGDGSAAPATTVVGGAEPGSSGGRRGGRGELRPRGRTSTTGQPASDSSATRPAAHARRGAGRAWQGGKEEQRALVRARRTAFADINECQREPGGCCDWVRQQNSQNNKRGRVCGGHAGTGSRAAAHTRAVDPHTAARATGLAAAKQPIQRGSLRGVARDTPLAMAHPASAPRAGRAGGGGRAANGAPRPSCTAAWAACRPCPATSGCRDAGIPRVAPRPSTRSCCGAHLLSSCVGRPHGANGSELEGVGGRFCSRRL